MTLLACLTGILVTTGALQAQIREARRHFDRANDLVSVSAYEQAVEEFRQTYLVDPWQVNAIYNIGRCYERMVEAGESPEMVLLHERRAIDAYKNYLEVSLQVVPKEPLRDKAMASISRLRQDVERIAAERAARLRGEEEVEKEREARERRALEEEKKALQERVNRMMAEREEEKAKQKVLQARRSSQVKWGLGLAGAGLGIAGVGGALLGRVGVMAAEARILIQFDKVAAADLVIESEPFLLSGAILTACGASVATFGAIRVASAGRDGGALWVGMGPRELMFGGRF